jgi:hypothetical protein
MLLPALAEIEVPNIFTYLYHKYKLPYLDCEYDLIVQYDM